MKPFTIISLLFLLVCQSSLAEELTAELCIIALGASPQREYSASGAMLLPREGVVPPSILYYKARGDDGDEWQSVNVRFNSSSTLQTIPAEKELRFYKKSPSGYSEYVTFAPMSQGAKKMIFLTPSAAGDTMWVSKPNQYSLLLDSENIEASDITMVNLSKAPLSCQVANKKLTLTPKKTCHYSHHEEGLCRISVSYGNQNKFAYNSGVKIRDEGGYLYVFYNANPQTNAGSDVGVFRMMIP